MTTSEARLVYAAPPASRPASDPNKALYLYPAAHYAFWRTVRMQALQRDEALAYGALGEQLTVDGLTESALWLGDEIRIGAAAFWVTGPALPSDDLNTLLGFRHAAKMMWESGYTGCYLRIKHDGAPRAGDAVTIVSGPREVSLAEQHAAQRRDWLRNKT